LKELFITTFGKINIGCVLIVSSSMTQCHQILVSICHAVVVHGSDQGSPSIIDAINRIIKTITMQANLHNAETLSTLASLKIANLKIEFTYEGWKDDYRAIIQSQIEDDCFGELRFGQSSTMTRDRFLGMINKQRLASGDRSHSQIAMLDSIKGSLTYPGNQKDIEHAERLHIRFPSLFEDQVRSVLYLNPLFSSLTHFACIRSLSS
jgi:hypothetical protein